MENHNSAQKHGTSPPAPGRAAAARPHDNCGWHRCPPPEADVYHSISTGYGGILATLGSLTYDKPLFLTEHGIYTREREEELLRAKWVLPTMR